MMNYIAIKPDVDLKDNIFSFDISNCEAQVPAGMVDNSVEPIYKEMPKWQETEEGAWARYLDVIKDLADKYLYENLLLVTHGEGVSSSVRGFVKDIDMICEVEYCAYSHLCTTIFAGENNYFTVGGFVGSPEDWKIFAKPGNILQLIGFLEMKAFSRKSLTTSLLN